MYNTLESLIIAQPFEIAEFLDEHADYNGKYCWLFVPKNSNNKVCLVAHIDTVFENRFETKEIIKEDTNWTSPQGICGDDRCGVYALLKIYKTLPEKNKPMLLFTDGEEKGGIGAYEAVKVFNDQLKDVSFFVELDRQGKDDMVFYNNEPDEFIDYIRHYGFKFSRGSFSDISILGKAFNICAVNVSVGYYKQHSLNEYIHVNELDDTIDKIYSLCIEETGKQKIWENEQINTWNKKMKKFTDTIGLQEGSWKYGDGVINY